MNTENKWNISRLVRVERVEKMRRSDDFELIYRLFGVVLPENIKELFKYFGWGGQLCSELRLFPGHLFSGYFEDAAKRALLYQQLSIEKLLEFVKDDPWVLDKYHGPEIHYENLFLIAKTGFADDFYLNFSDGGVLNILGVEDEGYVFNMGSLHEFLAEYFGNKNSFFRRGVGLDWSYEIGIPVSVREVDCRASGTGKSEDFGQL